MLRRLRRKLTLTYGLAALVVVIVVGMGSYRLVQHYFQADNDSALRYRMSLAFMSLGLAVPAELAVARSEWERRHGQAEGAEAGTPTTGRGGGSAQGQGSAAEQEELPLRIVDSELAPLYLIRIGSDGRALPSPAEGLELPPPAPQGIRATETEPDLRTVTLPDGRRARVLTYAVRAGPTSGSAATAVAYLQAGRLLADQDHLLWQLLLAVVGLCAAAVVAVGVVSWYVAGRSLGPARTAWENQQAFVANASHELRAPVTLIRIYAEYGLRKTPTPAQSDDAETLRDILTETDHLTRLVDDLVFLSRLDAARLQLAKEPVALADLLTEVAHSFHLPAEDKGVAIEVGGGEGTVLGDRTRLRQVLLIVLDNALRYTAPGGSISLASHARGTDVDVTVADTGTGISPDALPHVFERFYQSKKSREDEGSGSGLGLSIAKALVEAQGGKIHIVSKEGRGTTVTFTLRAAEAPRGS
jgi:signal transduction histidine kinase